MSFATLSIDLKKKRNKFILKNININTSREIFRSIDQNFYDISKKKKTSSIKKKKENKSSKKKP